MTIIQNWDTKGVFNQNIIELAVYQIRNIDDVPESTILWSQDDFQILRENFI